MVDVSANEFLTKGCRLDDGENSDIGVTTILETSACGAKIELSGREGTEVNDQTTMTDTWYIGEREGGFVVIDCNGLEVARCGDRKADAELIVEAVNSRVDLVSALHEAMLFIETLAENLNNLGKVYSTALDSTYILRRARALLSEAGGGVPRDQLLQ
ncbi:MAG: hypothetical protein E4H03_11635 [Myxococcales bacterium]|nr:MAG: hypothetical protein E4H03_11635 [Myxococcales bacterium]